MQAILFLLDPAPTSLPPAAREGIQALQKLRLDGRLEEAWELADQTLAGHPGEEWALRERALCLLWLEFLGTEILADPQRSLSDAAGAEKTCKGALALLGQGKTHYVQKMIAGALGDTNAGRARGPLGWVRSMLSPSSLITPSSRQRLQIIGAYSRILTWDPDQMLGASQTLASLPGPTARLCRAAALVGLGRLAEARDLLGSGCDEPILEEVSKACLDLLVEEPTEHKWGPGLLAKAWRLAQARHYDSPSHWLKHPVARHVAKYLGPIREVLPCSGDSPLCILQVATGDLVRLVTVGASLHWADRELMLTLTPQDLTQDWPLQLLTGLAHLPEVRGLTSTRLVPLARLAPLWAETDYAGLLLTHSLSAPAGFHSLDGPEPCCIDSIYPLSAEEIAYYEGAPKQGLFGQTPLGRRLRSLGQNDVVSLRRSGCCTRARYAPGSVFPLGSFRDYLYLGGAVVGWEKLLAPWGKLLEPCPHPLIPVAVTAFADWFLQDSQGGIWFLDTGQATFEMVAADRADWDRQVTLPERLQGPWFKAALHHTLGEVHGRRPVPGMCYGFRISPALGGPYEPANVHIVELNTYVPLTGKTLSEEIPLQ